MATIDRLPHDAFTRAASLSLFLFIMALSILWIAMKIVLWRHGDRGYFSPDDLRKLKLLAANESDKTRQKRYEILRYAVQICFVLVFAVPLFFLALRALASN